MSTSLDDRRERYFALSSRLAQVDSRQLAAWLEGTGSGHGWGGTHVLKLGGDKVFVKRIPLTELEYENLYSTANLYQMPALYNYGVGSAGFGAFRELVAHVKTTNWVLDGACPNFPLLYHSRIVPFTGTRGELDEERHQGYVRYWNSEPSIDRYIRARHRAKHEVILFLEHFPHVLARWIEQNPEGWRTVIREMSTAISFLRGQGVIHFDAHFWNIVVGEGIPYLTDFGLVLDRGFTLIPRERTFFRRHVDYDYAEFFASVGSQVTHLYRRAPARARKRLARRYGLPVEPSHDLLFDTLVENIEEIHAERLLPLDEAYVETVTRHRKLILLMADFFSRMGRNDRKNTPYPHSAIRRLLQQAGVVPITEKADSRPTGSRTRSDPRR
jgi:hypothetical protein